MKSKAFAEILLGARLVLKEIQIKWFIRKWKKSNNKGWFFH